VVRSLLVILFLPPLSVADWKPAPAPLMTKWGKELKAESVHPEYPRPQMERTSWLNLNGLWDYAITTREAPRPEKFDGQILVPFCVESALSGVGKKLLPTEALWYRRTINSSKLPKGERFLLHFQAVDFEATLFINGKEVGKHLGGNTPFSFDVSKYLDMSKGDQEIVLRVWDPTDTGSQPRGKQVLRPSGIFYTAVSGIWQTVWLEAVPNTFISRLKIVPDVDESCVRVTVSLDGTTTGEDLISVEIPGINTESGKADQPIKVTIPDPKLWSPDSPHLYSLNISLKRKETKLDTVKSYFGLRKISFAPDATGKLRMLLNNRPLFQYGPLDQGWWPDGLLTPPSDEAMAFDLKYLKQVGFNMLRKHIKVEPARLYYHCDQLGLLVWQDMPSGMRDGARQHVQPGQKNEAVFTEAEKKQFRQELKEMIDHLHNFSCIVVWVPFNEGWGQHDTNDVLKWVIDYDNTRLVDGPSGWEDRGYGHLKDMHNYPGPNMFPLLTDRVSVLGEFGGLGLPIEKHLWQNRDNWGYQTYKTRDELKSNYERLMLRLHPLIGQGLAAAVYTQTTDVEGEVNGLLTYDRAESKIEPELLARWHRRLYEPAPKLKVLLASSQNQPQKWRFTEKAPDAAWMKNDFADETWTEGVGGFGTKMTPNTTVRTEWKTSDIWLRRSFELAEVPQGEIYLDVYHDEDAEIYLNGVLAASPRGYVTSYGAIPISPEARKTLVKGQNRLAIHCKQTGGGQYIDAGLIELVPAKK
jgi:hypothetical protein